MIWDSFTNYAKVNFKDKHWLTNTYAKYNFFVFVLKQSIFSGYLINNHLTSLASLHSHQLKIGTKHIVEQFNRYFSEITELFNKKQAISYLFCINYWTLFSNKLLYAFINCSWFSNNWPSRKILFRWRRKWGKRRFRFRNKKGYRMIKNRKKKLYKYKKGILSITFTKRNMFLNLSNYKNKSLLVTSLRKLGFLGRRRREYTSILTATRLVKQTFRKYRIKFLTVIYKGWNRFRVAARNTIKYRDRYRIPTLFVKFAIKIPHNGCRLNKKKRKKRKKKVWLRKNFSKEKTSIDKRFIKRS